MELDVDFSTGLKESDRSERVESGSIPHLQEELVRYATGWPGIRISFLCTSKNAVNRG